MSRATWDDGWLYMGEVPALYKAERHVRPLMQHGKSNWRVRIVVEDMGRQTRGGEGSVAMTT
jgi:hypothetical protein